MSNSFCSRIKQEGHLRDPECDLLEIAKFLVPLFQQNCLLPWQEASRDASSDAAVCDVTVVGNKERRSMILS